MERLNLVPFCFQISSTSFEKSDPKRHQKIDRFLLSFFCILVPLWEPCWSYVVTFSCHFWSAKFKLILNRFRMGFCSILRLLESLKPLKMHGRCKTNFSQNSVATCLRGAFWINFGSQNGALWEPFGTRVGAMLQLFRAIFGVRNLNIF